MLQLATIVVVFLGLTLAAMGMVAALTMGRMDATSLIVSVAIGFVLVLPVSCLVAREIVMRG